MRTTLGIVAAVALAIVLTSRIAPGYDDNDTFPATATTTVINADWDVGITSSDNGASNEADTTVNMGLSGAKWIVSFDISGNIPSGDAVLAAHVTAAMHKTIGTTSEAMSIHRCFLPATSSASDTSYDGTNRWNAENAGVSEELWNGGDNPDSSYTYTDADLSLDGITTFIGGNITAGNDVELDATRFVRKIVNGTWPDYPLVITKLDTTNAQPATFRSADSSYGVQLTVVHMPPSTNPAYVGRGNRGVWAQ